MFLSVSQSVLMFSATADMMLPVRVAVATFAGLFVSSTVASLAPNSKSVEAACPLSDQLWTSTSRTSPWPVSG
jgi:hypothetical protein